MTPVIVSQERRRARVRRAVERERLAAGTPRHAFAPGELRVVGEPGRCPVHSRLDGARCVYEDGHDAPHLFGWGRYE